MLKLKRNVGEIVLVGDGAIMVMAVHGKSVELGFDFPGGTEVWRSELCHLTPAARRLIHIRQEMRRETEGVPE